MKNTITLLVLSDPHCASPAELARADPEGRVIPRPWLRPVARAFRRLWLGDLSRNNRMLEEFVRRAEEADFVVANGDFSCDSAFVGVSDDAALASARDCLDKLRDRFGARFEATLGDHELGRRSLFGGAGGLRLASWTRCLNELKLRPFWRVSLGGYVILGVTSSLLALESYRDQILPEERASWLRLRDEHLSYVRNAFNELPPKIRVFLFCHDPLALAWLAREEAVRNRFNQIEQTVTGHLHSRLVVVGIRVMAHLRSSFWRDFKVRVCPALACQLWPSRGLFYRVSLDFTAEHAPKFRLRNVSSNSIA